MIQRSTKAAYYALLSGPMFINGWIHRNFRHSRTGVVRVHLGPGQKKYLDGWVNVDANLFTAKADIWADLRNPLPFADESVDAFYSHHVIEHLPDQLLPLHIAEMFRCLKPGGAIRIGGPNGDVAARKLVEGDDTWFGDYPDRRLSTGGRYTNFILCRGEHLTILTASYLFEIAQTAGFRELQTCQPVTQTFHPNLFDQKVLGNEWELTPDHPHTLLIEAEKPLGLIV